METICGATFVFDHSGVPDLIENDLTGGAYRVMVGQAPAGDGPPMHVHPHTDEGFYVGEGELTLVFPDREVIAGPGSFVFVPRGVEHTARITKPLRGLLIYSPARCRAHHAAGCRRSGFGVASGSPR
jgi:mannose-6-phosphate isomerase-like protein (cupin superfamily)